MLIEYQRNLLADRVRNDAFYQALKQVIVPGKTIVADIGSGTGFLGFLAAKLGAKAVYLYEYTDIIKVSQKLARKNKIPNCHFIHAHTFDVESPVKADVVVSETLGNYAYEENIIEILRDAQRFLKTDGIVIPQSLQQYVSPVTTERFYRDFLIWDDVGFEIDFGIAKEATLNNLYVRTVNQNDLFESGHSAKRWDNADFNRNNASVRKGSASWKIDTATSIFGFAVWWDCQLYKEIRLTTSPLNAQTHWEQIYLPVLTPIHAEQGDTVQISINSDSNLDVGVFIDWSISLIKSNKKEERQELSMRKGFIG